MKLTTVESSMIHAVGYDPKTRQLEVVFNSGRTYCYEGVESEVYEGLLAAVKLKRSQRNVAQQRFRQDLLYRINTVAFVLIRVRVHSEKTLVAIP